MRSSDHREINAGGTDIFLLFLRDAVPRARARSLANVEIPCRRRRRHCQRRRRRRRHGPRIRVGEELARYNTRERSMERLIMMIRWPDRRLGLPLTPSPASFFSSLASLSLSLSFFRGRIGCVFSHCLLLSSWLLTHCSFR